MARAQRRPGSRYDVRRYLRQGMGGGLAEGMSRRELAVGGVRSAGWALPGPPPPK